MSLFLRNCHHRHQHQHHRFCRFLTSSSSIWKKQQQQQQQQEQPKEYGSRQFVCSVINKQHPQHREYCRNIMSMKKSSVKAISTSDTINNSNFISSSSRNNRTKRSFSAPTASNGTPRMIHPMSALSASEIEMAATATREALLLHENQNDELRFVAITLAEPPKKQYLEWKRKKNNTNNMPQRMAEVLVHRPSTGEATQLQILLQPHHHNNNDTSSSSSNAVILSQKPFLGQPLLTPDDCFLAEEIAKSDPKLISILKDRYGIIDVETEIAADPWSVHLPSPQETQQLVHWRQQQQQEETNPNNNKKKNQQEGRLVQTFLYRRFIGNHLQDNHYAHPIDILPVVDLNAKKVIRIDGLDDNNNYNPPTTHNTSSSYPSAHVNYHRDLLQHNTYLQTQWRHNALKQLNIIQPDGPSFQVDNNTNVVTWDKWSIRIGFNYREGLVLHDISYDNRPILHRISLVEMAVPYADPNPPYHRKCAFDVGDYGLGYCANSLQLGCDCLGHIHYFDAILCSSNGSPIVRKNVICMHEEDTGILWKHVEYRNEHNESRRARELVISSIATVVNYEYLFYWRFKLDGSIDFEIRLSGELSTNLPSSSSRNEEGEDPNNPSYGTLVAPGVNAQYHQHMFCVRIDPAIDGHKNTVSEVDIVRHDLHDVKNPYGNAFGPVETILTNEQEAIRMYDATKARCWKISNASKDDDDDNNNDDNDNNNIQSNNGPSLNPITKKPVSYKLYPFTRGPAQPTLMVDPTSCAVSTKGAFAKAHLWVTRHNDIERYPAGESTPQGNGSIGLPNWIENRKNNNNNNNDESSSSSSSLVGEDIVLWHAFGVCHIPRVEDFPVMPCESTGFTLKPDGFFSGNPAIDLPPDYNQASKLSTMDNNDNDDSNNDDENNNGGSGGCCN